MAFRNKAEIIGKFNPDIAVIQECENEVVLKNKKSTINYNTFICCGVNRNKGLGVMSFNDWKIELLNHNDKFKYILPVRIFKNKTEFFLLAVWTQFIKNNRYTSYIVQATTAFNYYKDLLQKENIIIAGDFNSNVIWDIGWPKECTHNEMVKTLLKYEIVSVYHEKYLEEQGKEKIPTYYFTKNMQKPFHIDYVFIKKKLLESVSFFNIGEYNEYIKQSDHMPLFAEIIKKSSV
jgi:exodeoxyribonuclease-3